MKILRKVFELVKSFAKSVLRKLNVFKHYFSSYEIKGRKEQVIFANNVKIAKGVIFDVKEGGKIILSKNVDIRRNVIIQSCGGTIEIGENSGINYNSIIYGHGGLKIGSHVWIAANCVVIPANHDFSRLDVPIYAQQQSKKGIVIKDDVWIGANCTITDGVSINRGAVVGAGSVVTKDIPSFCIYAGVPAKLIGKRKFVGSLNINEINGFTIDGISEIAELESDNDIKFVLDKEISESFLYEEERSFPNHPDFLKNEYYRIMLKRYLFAAYNFCKEKRVLESCCGLGWGAYLVSRYAKEITAFDLSEKVLDFCRSQWDKDNIEWVKGDALDFSFLGDRNFEIVLAMETIEHFKKDDGIKYIENVYNVLEPGGCLIGTSSFPEKRSDADKLAETNIYHLYIWTKNEMEDLLKKYFKEYVIINNWIFMAKK